MYGIVGQFIDNIWIFDFEVLAYDWLLVASPLDGEEYFVAHNDNALVAEFMKQKPLLCGFNTKHYDDHIMKGVLLNFDPEMVKETNDLIIQEGVEGWQIPFLKHEKVYFDSFDLMDDCQKGTSLKAFEGHMGMPIVESSVPFDIDRPLTEEELAELIYYCKKDVDASKLFCKIREGYLLNKITLGEAKGYSARKALRWTNAKATAMYLDAHQPKEPFSDEREYRYPGKLNGEYIPQEVFDYFNRMYDESISRNDVYSEKLEIQVGRCPVTLGFGGIHGAIPTYHERETEKRIIRNKDVASLYPHLMTLFGYTSRAIEHPEDYAKVLSDRIEAKNNHNTSKNFALKLVLVTTYGCLGNGVYENGKYIAYNELYDPLMCRSVCITGQLLLLELAEHLVQDVKSLTLIQLNTDGIMVSMDREDEPLWQSITQEWQDRTGLTLEEDFIKTITQRDVNSYVEVAADGSVKAKGGDLVRGVLTNGNVDFTSFGFPKWDNLSGGAFKINNDAVIVAEAVTKYFVDGTLPEETIGNCDEILRFQLISKASHKYSRCYQISHGVEVACQRVNRVYASPDLELGTLYKIHSETGSINKISGLPMHCIIDNNNHLSIEDIDKDWYIRKAWDVIRAFQGIKYKRSRKVSALRKEVSKCLDRI